MNLSLKYYDQMQIIPIYQSAIILTNVLCGAIIFQEMNKYKDWKICMVILGVLICVSGILVIFRKNN
jgi:hypothetical protein